MKVKILNDGNLESLSWTVVKIFVALVAFSLVLPPISRGWSSRFESGLKTVLPARIRAAQVNTISLEFSAKAVSVRVKAGDRVVAGQLLASENIEWFVVVEGMDHVIAVRPDVARIVGVIADGVCEADHIEPANRHPLTELRFGKERLNQAGVGFG